MKDKSLSICLITSMHDWNDDRIFERTAVGLARSGHLVTLVAPAEKDMESEGVKILSIPKRGRFGKHLFGPSEAMKRVSSVEADIYHFFNPNLMWKMRRFARKGKNVFIDIHENYESRLDKAFLPAPLRNFLIRSYRKRENRICSSFKGVTVVTKSMKQKLSSSKAPVMVMDNVPYLDRLKEVKLSDKRPDRPTIITSGTHSEARNCLNAVKALPAIVKKHPEVLMKFVGRFHPESYEIELIEEAEKLGVRQNLVTEGMLPWLENFRRVSHAHIGCVFYNDNLNNRVTLPNRLYEYMYSGIAVAGEDFPEVRNVIQHSKGGILVNSTDPESIAKGLLSMLDNSEELEKMAENGRNAVTQNYNFENTLEQLIDFYFKNVAW